MTETISAIATPAGRGGVGIVRTSGPDSREILGTLVPDWPDDHPSHKLRHSEIRTPEGELLDRSLAVFMEGPETYTGEDVVEFQCHGGPMVMRRVLDATLECGARMAEPGEFTRRAFLNGRIDLTQAEAVADLVEATSERAHEMALDHLEGRLGSTIEQQRERVGEALTLIEASIDFSHQAHVGNVDTDEVLERVDAALDELRRLEEQFDRGRRQREGVRVVILGPTNAGKSTLFNALHGTDRAIITPVEGTTRDFLEEELRLGGATVRLVDTAGLRQTDDEVETIGIERSRELKDDADVAVWTVDRSCGLDADSRDVLEQLRDEQTPTVVALNKSDLEDGLADGDRGFLEGFDRVVETAFPEEAPAEGLDALTDELEELAERLTSGEGVLLSRTRHLEGVRSAIESLERARRAVVAERELEFIAVDLRDGLDALGEIVGEVSTDDILGRIFDEFCVGK
ncbi:MAG: tRNA uridine-5-carboxymethylaminomethyl(34) synthesis GTPase MnmE [Bradymonadaceae bacterium]